MDIAALKAAAQAVIDAKPNPEGWKAVDAYDAAVSPEAILSMIARLEALEEALREAEAFNAEHGDVADTLHHGNAILAFFRAEPVQS